MVTPVCRVSCCLRTRCRRRPDPRRHRAGDRRSHLPAPERPPGRSGWQAGTCTVDTPTCTSTRPPSSSKRPPGIPRSASPSSSSSTTKAATEKAGGRTEDRPRRPPGWAQRQPRRDRRSARWRPSSQARLTCPRRLESRLQRRQAPRSSVRSRSGATTEPTVYNIVPAGRRTGAVRPSTCSATTSSAKPTSPGTATTTRASRSTFPQGPATLPLVKGGVVLKNRLSSTGAPGTAPSSPRRAPAWAQRQLALRACLLDLAARRLDTEEEDPGYAVPRGRPPLFESRIPPGTTRKTATPIPFEPSIAVEPSTAVTDSPSGSGGRGHTAAPDRSGGRTRKPRTSDREGRAARRDGAQSLGRQRPAGMHRRAVRQGHAKSRPTPARPNRRSARSRSRRRRCPRGR